MSDKEATEARQALEGYTSALIGVGEAVTIVRDLAATEPLVSLGEPVHGTWEACGLCEAVNMSVGEPVEHAESCPWRRAVEWVERHPTENTTNVTTDRIQDYLDGAITNWRRIAVTPSHEHNAIAIYYVDAFQSARQSILGSTLP